LNRFIRLAVSPELEQRSLGSVLMDSGHAVGTGRSELLAETSEINTTSGLLLLCCAFLRAS
jgi:hypothetical protein